MTTALRTYDNRDLAETNHWLEERVAELQRAAAVDVAAEWSAHPNLIMYTKFEIAMESAVNVLAKTALDGKGQG